MHTHPHHTLLRLSFRHLAILGLCLAWSCQKAADRAPAPNFDLIKGPEPLGKAALADTVNAIEVLKPASPFTVPTPILRWTPLVDGAFYKVEIDDSEECTSPLQTFETAEITQQARFLSSGQYFICITAHTIDGEFLTRASGSFWVATPKSVDARLQNGQAGNGSPIESMGLVPFALFQDDPRQRQRNRDSGPTRADGADKPSSVGAYSDPNANGLLKLVVNDRGNHRVLIYDTMPTFAAAATTAVGQPDLSSGELQDSTGSANFGDNVHASVCADGKLLVTDRARNRVLIWKQIPTSNGDKADLVIGQVDMGGSAAGSGPTQLNSPTAAYCIGNKLWIVDQGNFRILVYNRLPTVSGTAADFAVGQDDLSSHTAGCSASRFGAVSELLVVAGDLLVSDSSNHRVLRFSPLPTAFGATADLALGQPTLTTCDANRHGQVAANSLLHPTSLAARGDELLIADTGNHRILGYRGELGMGQNAAFVIGQKALDKDVSPQFADIDVIKDPSGLVYDGSFVWTADPGFNRVLLLRIPEALRAGN